jgi:hypothetical protein
MAGEITGEYIYLEKTIAAAMCEADAPDERAYWAEITHIPVERMYSFPNEGLHRLNVQLHEMRHLKHLRPDEYTLKKEHTHPIPHLLGYYRELDSDLHALKSFEEAKIGFETNKATINARYLQTFWSASQYYFAPALEKIMSGKPPQGAWQIYDATVEVLLRMAMQDQGTDQNGISSQQLQNAVAVLKNRRTDEDCGTLTTANITSLANHYDQNIGGLFRAGYAKFNPNAIEVILPQLRVLYESGVFTDSLSSQIAGRILEAGEYFSPGISYQCEQYPKQQRQPLIELAAK